MDVAAKAIDHAAGIAGGVNILVHILLCDHLETTVPVAFPVLLVRLHLTDLFFREGSEEAPVNQVALDAILRHPVTDDLPTLQRHLSKLGGFLLAVAAGDGLEIPAVAIDDLAAIAARGSKADPLSLQHNHRVSPLAELQGRRDTSEASSDDADIGIQISLERRPDALVIG